MERKIKQVMYELKFDGAFYKQKTQLKLFDALKNFEE